MRNKTLKSLMMIPTLALSSLFTTSCKKKIVYNYDNFFGMCEVCGELSNGVDYALTNDAIADKAAAMKCKSFRIWLSVGDLFIVDDNDNLSIKQTSYQVMKDHCDKLYEAGVRNFCFMYTSFVYPKDYVPSTGYVVPDPVTEYKNYIRFLNLMGKAASLIAEYFPMATIIEPGNEPDFENSSCVHKNGYVFGGDFDVNSPHLFTDEEKAAILDDICWYCKKYLKDTGHDKCKVAIPGLTNLDTAPEFLSLMYDCIKSKGLPAGQKYSDTNVDDYFDYLNWHPYTHGLDDEVNEDWLDYQKEMYDAAVSHGDDGRPVIFTEFGQTDFGYQSGENLEMYQQKIAQTYIDGFNMTKQHLPMVETIFCFRMFTLVHQDISAGENNFGLFYNPDEVESLRCKAKPAAIAIAKYFNGDDYDVSVLDRDYRAK